MDNIIKLSGEFATGHVYLNGKLLNPARSLLLANHSPTGFAWGYSGSGPSQLALAVCVELFGEEAALEVYQEFKRRYIATLPEGDFSRTLEIDL